jgi:amino acid transporter
MLGKMWRWVVGKPRDLNDPEVYHHISLVAFLAWVGLGADGLSSSAYGPDEAYRALGAHSHLAPLLVLMTAVTIIVISVAYSDLIQYFPGGGGGYLVASKLLGPRVGVVSGCALLVDYVLTISVSIASSCDALWSFLPQHYLAYKFPAEFIILGFLMVLNLRGAKESITVLMPIFLLFLATHLFLILYSLISHFTALPTVFHGAAVDFRSSVSALGFAPIMFVLLRAYSMGGGTYTGIEAVSNGVTMLREPRVQTGKKTMFLMAASLAFTAGGILFGYMLVDAMPVAGKTMNAVLLENLFGSWMTGGLPIGRWLVITTLVSEAALLIVAAQTGFLDGPRVLANMSLDSWVPHRFAELSDRLVAKNGVFLMGVAAMATLYYTKGNITTLVIMYSINVFITFTLTELGMTRHWIIDRKQEPRWKSRLAIHGTGLVMCASILTITLYEKFSEGGWVTVAITGVLILLCYMIRKHYDNVKKGFGHLDDVLAITPLPELPDLVTRPMDKNARTAVLTVPSYSGFGMHHLLAILKLFPGHFTNVIFVSVGVIDTGNFKGSAEIGSLESRIRLDLEKYVRSCENFSIRGDYRMVMDTEAFAAIERICRQLSKEFPNSIVFTGKLLFRKQHWYQRLLHNETAFALQRKLQLDGIPTMVLPIRA